MKTYKLFLIFGSVFLIISAIVLGLFIGLLDSALMQREQKIETVAVSKFAGNWCIIAKMIIWQNDLFWKIWFNLLWGFDQSLHISEHVVPSLGDMDNNENSDNNNACNSKFEIQSDVRFP